MDIQGTTTTIDSVNLDVKDKNITLNYGTGDTSANANGAGITIQDAVNSTTNATILWDKPNSRFTTSHGLNVGGTLTIPSSGPNFEIDITGGNAGNIRAYSHLYILSQSGTLNLGAGGTNSQFSLATNGNATFTGSINSGAITSTSSITGRTGTFTGQNGTALSVNSGTTNVVALFESSDATAWINLKDSNSSTYGTLLGAEGGLFRLRTNNNDANTDLTVDTSGNLSVSGTLNSGAITSTGSIVSSGVVTANSAMQIIGATGSSGYMYLYDRDVGTSPTANGFLIQKTGTHAYVRNRESAGKLFLGAGDDADHLTIFANGDYYAGTTKWFDQARNLSNIGTVTATGGNSTNWNTAYTYSQTDADVLRKRTNIPASANLNTYTAIGLYHQNGNTNAASGSNYPISQAGMLTVTANSIFIYQTYQAYSTNGTYERKYYNGTWQSWHLVYDSGVFTNNSANWNTAYTVANAALPKAGGTMTGTLAMGANAITSTGNITAGAYYGDGCRIRAYL